MGVGGTREMGGEKYPKLVMNIQVIANRVLPTYHAGVLGVL